MDNNTKNLDSSSEDSLGSDEDDLQYNGGGASGVGTGIVESDSLLDSSDDSDSNDDVEEAGEDMEVDEDALNQELLQINDQLAANPYAYELYGEKIKILKKIGDLGKLRDTREKFSELYPLSEQLWLEWLRDEVKLACTDEEKDSLLELFERAVVDYLSVDVWLEYINFRISRMGTENGIEKCRDVFERALSSCGIHVSMGSVIWDMYRDFEAALLGATTTEEQQKAQENRYVSICKRQLSVPLLGMSEVYEDIKSKIDIDENTEGSYRKALERLDALEIWESKLIHPSEDKPQIFKEYIEDEKKIKSNPARIQCLYERAIASSPLDSTVWVEYLDYLGKNLKIAGILLDIAQRSSRNCSWDINIWLKYMSIVEQFCEADKVSLMKNVFEKAILYLGAGETAGTIWLKYLEFLRRQVKLENLAEKQLEILRKTFDAAEQHLLQLLPEPNDFISEILLFKLRFEAQCAKSVNEEVLNIWKDMLTRGYGQFGKTWLQYIMQVNTYGSGVDVKKMRSLYSKAVSYVQDDLPTISSLWINFERDHGDILSLQQCEAKISAQMAKVVVAAPPNYVQPEETRVADFFQKGRKRKIDENKDNHLSSKKGRMSEDAVDSDKGGSVFKMPSLPPKTPQKKNLNDTKVGTFSDHGESVKHDSSKDNRTAFLSNLAYTTGETEITGFFDSVGKIEEIRLAKDYKGRSKGFGFVCFSTTAEARAALEKDRQPLGGRPVFVSRCDPDKTTRQKQFKYSNDLEKNKLFVKGLPFSMTVDELRNVFKEHGEVKDCRLVTYRNGHSKGLAYVEYTDEIAAKQAILKTDGTMIGDKKISVALSNPPVRDSSKSGYQSGNTFSNSSLVSDTQRRAPRAFVPRSLQLSSGTKKEDSSPAEGKSAAPVAPKSNQDFRNMFLK